MNDKRTLPSDDPRQGFMRQVFPGGEPVVCHVANSNTAEPYHAAQVVIPIIRCMAEVPMCWADRERCANALVEALWEYNQLMKEHRAMQREGGAGNAPKDSRSEAGWPK